MVHDGVFIRVVRRDSTVFQRAEKFCMGRRVFHTGCAREGRAGSVRNSRILSGVPYRFLSDWVDRYSLVSDITLIIKGN